MIVRDLTPEEITAVLQKQCYAHLGFLDTQSTINVLPITYVYDDNCLYSFSGEGGKLQAMRQNPNVCLQIEHLQEPDSWQSVQVWGKYVELERGAWNAVEKLIESFWEHHDKEEVIYTPLRDFHRGEQGDNIVYKIEIERTTGKLGGHESRMM